MTDSLTGLGETLGLISELREARETERRVSGELARRLKLSISAELGNRVLGHLTMMADEISTGGKTVVSYFTVLSLLERAWRTGRHATEQRAQREPAYLALRIEDFRHHHARLAPEVLEALQTVEEALRAMDQGSGEAP